MSVAVKEAAAPLISVAAPLWFQKFWRKKYQYYGIYRKFGKFGMVTGGMDPTDFSVK